jgi:hypothetical protein
MIAWDGITRVHFQQALPALITPPEADLGL